MAKKSKRSKDTLSKRTATEQEQELDNTENEVQVDVLDADEEYEEERPVPPRLIAFFFIFATMFVLVAAHF